MKILIFGAGGQDGFYLSEFCRQKNIEVIGVSRHGNWIKGDVSNLKEVEKIVCKYMPDYIFDFAAKSSTKHNTLYENHNTISTGTLNILESVYRFSPKTKVFLSGSGVQFKNLGNPISENDEFEANSPYSISRIHSVYAARYYRSLGLKVYIGYLFHHESPFRQSNHVSKMISQTVYRIANGEDLILNIGDISVEREWTFAGDVVEAMFSLIEQDKIYEATIGSGVTHTIGEWIELCFKVVGINDWKRYIHIKKNFKCEYKRLVSDPSTIKSLGWSGKVDFADLGRIMMNVKKESNIIEF